MKSYKWLKGSFPISISKVFDVLLLNKYTEETGEGYVLNKLRESYISGRYIQRKYQVIDVVDPYGNKSEVEVINYLSIFFTIFESKDWFIEIENPGRSITPFINSLSKIFGFGFHITELSMDLEKILTTLDIEFGSHRLSKIEITNINLENKGVGSLIIKSEFDARDIINNDIIKYTDYKFKLFKTYIDSYEDSKGWIEVKSNGSLTISNIPISQFMNMFRELLVTNGFFSN